MRFNLLQLHLVLLACFFAISFTVKVGSASYKIDENERFYLTRDILGQQLKQNAATEFYLYNNLTQNIRGMGQKQILFPGSPELTPLDEIPLFLFKIHQIECEIDTDEYIRRLIHSNLKIKKLKDEYIRSKKRVAEFHYDFKSSAPFNVENLFPTPNNFKPFSKNGRKYSGYNQPYNFNHSSHSTYKERAYLQYPKSNPTKAYQLKSRGDETEEPPIFFKFLRDIQWDFLHDESGNPYGFVIAMKKVVTFLISERFIVYTLFGIMAIVAVVTVARNNE